MSRKDCKNSDTVVSKPSCATTCLAPSTNIAHGGRPAPWREGLAWRALRVAKHHTLVDRCFQNGRQCHPFGQRQADGHGPPHREEDTTFDDIVVAVKEAGAGGIKGVLHLTGEGAVSTDFVSCRAPSLFEIGAGVVLNSNFVKLAKL